MDKIIKRTIDNSYVIVKNGLPYHVPNEGEFVDEWEQVNAYAEAHPDEVVLEYPPEPVEEIEEETPVVEDEDADTVADTEDTSVAR